VEHRDQGGALQPDVIRDRARARAYAVAWLLLAVAAAGIAAANWYWSEALPLLVIAMVSVAFAIRSARSGIYFAQDYMLVRGVTWTRRLTREEVVGAKTMRGSMGNPNLQLVGVEMRNRSVIAPSTLVVKRDSETAELLSGQLQESIRKWQGERG